MRCEMNIIEAYRYLEKGYQIKRNAWKDWFSLNTDQGGLKGLGNMLYCKEKRQLMLISLEDVLAEDWEIKKESVICSL